MQSKIREFLTKYRSQGLPNAKKFRKRTRLAKLYMEIAIKDGALRELVERIHDAVGQVDELSNEINWAVVGGERGEEQVLWLPDDSPLEALDKLRYVLDPRKLIKKGDFDGPDAESNSAGYGQSDYCQPAASEGERRVEKGASEEIND